MHFSRFLSKSAPMTKDLQLKRIEELETQLESLSTELEEAKLGQLRALADLQNVQRRENDNKKNWVTLGIAEFLRPLLSRFGELRLGSEHSQDKDMKKAVEHFFNELKKAGVEEIIPQKGTPIDPDAHEVLMTEEGKPGTITKVLEPGWKFGETILSPAKVAAAQNS